jgi:Spy/CpxP family protein refolding chaperone
MRKRLAVCLLALLPLVAPPLFAADDKSDVNDPQMLRNAIRGDKKAFVESQLQLTPAEAKKFWPIYDTYQRHVDGINRRRNVAVETLIARDKPITELYAKSLANELIATDEAEIKARRTLHNKVIRALPDVKAARYLQLESKFRAVQAYDIATTIPLIR